MIRTPLRARTLALMLSTAFAAAAATQAQAETAAAPANETTANVTAGDTTGDTAAQAAPSTFARAIAAARAGDTATAAALFLPLARSGDAVAQFNLALLYYDGRGLPQNHAEALYWAWRARLAGRTEALALITRMADAATPDLRSAIATRIEADLHPRVTAGEGRAMLELSFVLTDILPEPDLTGAYVWQALSAAFETPNAIRARDATFARLDPKDRPAAQQRALETLKSLCDTGLGDPVCTALF
ncbi:sel1 repeat family protein [Paragemmobacter straminiformis]|uniref:Sel1 repeat family protein n=1 Tax=Paragemmobacter straminiformis TaxID=2045119 RepID=A0A842I746_9RHOB|nr:sel1 repeat family protein [Gemmobacter straminiformis]MBC2834798.1 sel1 repeat family protein [Gemmobacter straminiformis]